MGYTGPDFPKKTKYVEDDSRALKALYFCSVFIIGAIAGRVTYEHRSTLRAQVTLGIPGQQIMVMLERRENVKEWETECMARVQTFQNNHMTDWRAVPCSGAIVQR